MIETEYKGYKIRWSDNADEWDCFDLNYSHAQLSKIKAKINALNLKERKGCAVDAMKLGYGESIERVSVIEYVGPIRPHRGRLDQASQATDHSVQVLGKSSSGNKSRSKVQLSNLVKVTPDIDERIAKYRALQNEANAARSAVYKFRDEGFVPLSLDDIADLVKLSDADVEV